MILFHRVGAEEIVECLNALSGKPMSEIRLSHPFYRDALGKGDGPRSTPVITGDKVVTLGRGGQSALPHTLEAGKKLWSHSLTGEYKTPLGYFGIGTSPGRRVRAKLAWC